MDDLTGIVSFSHFEPQKEEEAQWKAWAGDTGFIVRMGKPYYWQANTPKEKEFFIGSLVKIFRKYTKGRVPDLVGFSARELQQLTDGAAGGPRPRNPSAGRPQPSPMSATRSPAFEQGQLSSPEPLFAKSQTPDSLSSRTGSRPPTANDERPPFRQQRSPSAAGQTPPPGGMFPPPQIRGHQSRDRDLRQPPSREPVRPPFGQERLTPQSSRSDIASQRQGTPDSLSIRRPPGASPEKPSYQIPLNVIASGEEGSSNGLGISADRWKSGGPDEQPRDRSPSYRVGVPDQLATAQPNGSREAVSKAPIPERRRPPMGAPPMNGSQQSLSATPQQGPNPLASPSNDVLPSAASSNDNLLKTSRGMPGSFISSPSPSDQLERDGLIPPPLQTSPKFKRDELKQPAVEEAPAPTPPPPAPTAPEPEPEKAPEVQPPEASKEEEKTEEPKKESPKEAARPGLGRMFGGNKKTTAELIRKAANAYTTFKPRAGGAAAKMRQQEETKSDEADGITGVFTPALKRAETSESAKTSGSIQTTPIDAKSGETIPSKAVVPEVKVSSPISPIQPPENAVPTAAETAEELPKSPSAASLKKKQLAEEEAVRKRKRRSAQQAQYLSKLGVDPTIFEGRGLEFEEVLTDFGWGTSAFRDKSIDQLENDLKRDIARVEAGSWLENLGQKDERVEAVEKLLDRAIAEVDEFEGLLTLYSVELSVGIPSTILGYKLTGMTELERGYRIHRSSVARSASTDSQPETVAIRTATACGDDFDYAATARAFATGFAWLGGGIASY
jgi:exocyst complex component 1